MSSIPCPLCKTSAEPYFTEKERLFLKCATCKAVLTHPDNFLDSQAEKVRYELHKNDPHNEGYQKFVSPITSGILNDFSPAHKGLDFGSGTGSPIIKVLRDNNYNIVEYDLYFHNHPELLHQKYDYIACCEVAEHFKKPHKEFALLRGLLKPGGKLYLMTEMIDDSKDFAVWYYKKDPTHVFLFHPETFEWIKKEFGFKDLKIHKRLAALSL
jgi:SAM-dependent methyltransferase